ncbi:MAG: murein biosynthesis integral membrane protein MurJ [Candidatus Pacebacteria bacterium]|nr:murein biosynthesis integral membrane protein MurJ [Candidatus Paceibacterota bacterium]
MGYLSLNTQTKSLSLASFILGLSYLVSAFLGFFRDRILASEFGATRQLDIYYAAFRLPDLVATIFIFGAITAAIIPVFSQYLTKSSKMAWDFTANLLNLFIIILLPFCILMIALAPYLISIIAPGFSYQERETAAVLLRIMFLGPIILGLSNVISSILQVFQKFLITSLTPIVYNLGIIFGALFLVPKLGLMGLAFGVVLGALFHLLVQLPAFWSCGFKLKPILHLRDEGFKKVIKLMLPRSFALAVSQLNLIFITSLASTLAPGAITVFNLASNLSGTLTNLLAVSISTVVFPALSLAFAQKAQARFRDNFSLVVRGFIFLILPLSCLLFIFREGVIKLIFGTGSFQALDIKLTAACLGIFCLGMLPQGLILILVKAFYAIGNTKLPALISSLAVVFNVVLSFLLLNTERMFHPLSFLTRGDIDLNRSAILILPLAFSLASFFQCVLLWWSLKRKMKAIEFHSINLSLLKTFLSAISLILFSSLVVFFTNSYNWLLSLFLGSTVGVLAFLLAAWILRSIELKMIFASIGRLFNFKR